MVILLVMFSRNYLGVHTPQDVLTGAAVGLLSAFLLPCLLRWAEKGPNRGLNGGRHRARALVRPVRLVCAGEKLPLIWLRTARCW